ncbi:MAG: ABC transporter ATP-binding protein [Polyangiaceae bacterium]
MLVLDHVSARYDRSDAPRLPASSGDEDGAPWRLRDVSLTLAPGELTCVLGANGAGKSTLLRVMAGTLAPERGTVTLFDAPLAGMSRRDVAKSLAVVPQSQDVAFGFTVRDVVMMGRAPHQDGFMRASPEDVRAVDDALERFDLGRHAHARTNELSGGEQKRVGLARAIVQKPKVLLLDEPSAFLDVRHEIELFDLLASEVERSKLACLVVLHDLNIAAQYASKVVLLRQGTIVAAGAVDQVMTYRLLRETFDADLYVGVNDLTKARFFLPMRSKDRG